MDTISPFKRMGPGRMMALLTLLTLLAVLVSTLVPEVISDNERALSEGECERCHTGFEPFVTQVDSPTEVPETHQFEFGLLVQNPWTHDLNDLVLTVDLSDSPGLEFMDVEPPENLDITETDTAPARGSTGGNLMINSMVEQIRISLDWTRPILFTGDLELTFSHPENTWSETSDDEIVIGGDEIGPEDLGPYQWMVENTAMARSVDFTIHIEVIYKDQPDILTQHASNIGPGESGTMKIPLRSSNKSMNSISYELQAVAHYEHDDKGTDEDSYNTGGTHSLEVGDDLKYSRPTEKITLSTSLWIIGRILGFFTVALFIASFLTGGTIGSVRKWMDSRTRNRVRWHCVISYAVIISAVVHLAVLYLGYYSGTSKGLISGGLPLLLMIIVGISGYRKDLIIGRWGLRTWKVTHFWLSILVIVLFIIHGVLEGTDLAFLRWW